MGDPYAGVSDAGVPDAGSASSADAGQSGGDAGVLVLADAGGRHEATSTSGVIASGCRASPGRGTPPSAALLALVLAMMLGRRRATRRHRS
jgi:uncharacterized protein (TIGR03382 family)